MKKYNSLGEILVDYRKHYKISQSEFASKLDVDIRSIIRWEKNETLVNSEKEKLLTQVTFIPFQVIRNLNTSTPIAIFYDFNLDKYSLTGISSELPDAKWIAAKIDRPTTRIKQIENKDEIKLILRNIKLQNNPLKSKDPELFLEASRLLPELNFVILDQSDNYSGYCLYFPLSIDTYNKLRDRSMQEHELNRSHLVNWRTQEVPVFYCHTITADSNENFFYVIGNALKFYRDTAPEDYIYALLTSRYDSYAMSEQLGVKVVWEDRAIQKEYNLLGVPRLEEGDFKAFFKSIE